MLTFYYDFASSYSYLAAMRMEDAAREAGLAVAWQPILLGPIFEALGVGVSPNIATAPKAAYMWRDIGRRAAARGLPFRTPTHFPQRSVAAARIALSLEEERPAFTRAVFTAQFAAGADIADPAVLAAAAAEAGVDPARALPTAEAKAALFETTAAAQRAGVFGAPSFVAPDGELFWGDDRLDDALAWARGRA